MQVTTVISPQEGIIPFNNVTIKLQGKILLEIKEWYAYYFVHMYMKDLMNL